eukprot:4014041-Amphidinium_carterae.1
MRQLRHSNTALPPALAMRISRCVREDTEGLHGREPKASGSRPRLDLPSGQRDTKSGCFEPEREHGEELRVHGRLVQGLGESLHDVQS